MINEPAGILKDIVELPSKRVSVTMGRAALTNRVATTEYTANSKFSENVKYLSDKPLRRPTTRRLRKD
jgi:hypothetical protein